MGDGGFADIILIAMGAAFLVLRLRSVLGRRDGHQGRYADPFARRGPKGQPADDKVVHLPERATAPAAEIPAPAWATDAGALGAGLAQISIADPKFDLDEFISGAKIAFEMILEAFAHGNRTALKPLLSPEVFRNFARVMDDRDRGGEKVEQTLVGIKGEEAIEARIEGSVVQITVKFVSEQINAVRNREGEVVEGDPNTVSEVTDLWTFARDTHTRDPNWILIGTGTLA